MRHKEAHEHLFLKHQKSERSMNATMEIMSAHVYKVSRFALKFLELENVFLTNDRESMNAVWSRTPCLIKGKRFRSCRLAIHKWLNNYRLHKTSLRCLRHYYRTSGLKSAHMRVNAESWKLSLRSFEMYFGLSIAKD
jgi:hypothetical protein